MVSVLYSSTIQPQTEHDLKLTKFLAVISPYLAKYRMQSPYMRSISFLSPFYLSETTYVIS